jgi:hypothetical protein
MLTATNASSVARISAILIGPPPHILHRIALAENSYAEARRHILNAIDLRGLNEEEIANAQGRLEEIDATLATALPT